MREREDYGSANGAGAETREFRRASLGEIHANEVELEQAAVRSIRAGEVEAEQSAILLARADKMKMEQSSAGVVVARELEATDLRALVVLAPTVRGNVRTLFDLRTAVAVGFGYFLARRLFGMINDAMGWARTARLRRTPPTR